MGLKLSKKSITISIAIIVLLLAFSQQKMKIEPVDNFVNYHKIDKAWVLSKGGDTKIAVLDWLFDMSDKASMKYVNPTSLIPGQNIGDYDPWHGEWMAEIIHQIAPEAKIIPIRARPDREENKSKTLVEEAYEKYLIEGIRFAADQGAVAVTNSMGPVKNGEELVAAVEYASQKGTIFIDVHPEYVEIKDDKYVFCELGICNELIIHVGIVSVDKYPLNPSETRDIYTWPYDSDPVYKDGWGYSNGPLIIAGIVALMKSVNPKLTVKEIKEILIQTSILENGFKIVNAEAAVIESETR